MKLLLDTCCVIWAVSEPSAISNTAKASLTAPDSEIYVSAITVAELACAVERRRIVIDRHWKKWFRHYTALNNWQVEAISLEIMEEAYSLPDSFHADPADRIIVATARINDATVVTKDQKILGYPHVKSLW
jgi:PIN domain nuclease of toxin-antitoxin system